MSANLRFKVNSECATFLNFHLILNFHPEVNISSTYPKNGSAQESGGAWPPGSNVSAQIQKKPFSSQSNKKLSKSAPYHMISSFPIFFHDLRDHWSYFLRQTLHSCPIL